MLIVALGTIAITVILAARGKRAPPSAPPAKAIVITPVSATLNLAIVRASWECDALDLLHDGGLGIIEGPRTEMNRCRH